MASELVQVMEGRTRLFVPPGSLGRRVPATFPVFFNPAARTNRDVSVAVAAATRPRTYLDALAATGARGVRVANECAAIIGGGDGLAAAANDGAPPPAVTMLDFNINSLKVASKNIGANGIGGRCTLLHGEANRFLYSRFEREEKFDAIDLDPFGSPAPYVQAALVAAADGAVLSMTATDAAVLCGVYPQVCARRYGASSARSEFVHETAIRILFGFAARMGGINDIGISPLLAHSTLHYIRVFMRVRRGATEADEAVGRLGFVAQCGVCQSRFTTQAATITAASPSSPPPPGRCPVCGSQRVAAAGPLWLGRIASEDGLVSQALDLCDKEAWEEAAGILAGLRGVDAYPPYSYSLERTCSRLGVASARVERVLSALWREGFKASRQPFEENGIKTDAGYKDFARVVAVAAAPRSSLAST